MTAAFRLIVIVLAAPLALAGCDRMANQKKQNPYETYSSSSVPADRMPPPGTVPRDAPDTAPPPLNEALLRRGQQRFDIDCAPCHGRIGEGDGMVVQRGFPRPPSYGIARLREAPVQHFYDVMTNGYGAMYSYAARVAPRDRWAIAAYIRVLQASQSQPVALLPPDVRKGLP